MGGCYTGINVTIMLCHDMDFGHVTYSWISLDGQTKIFSSLHHQRERERRLIGHKSEPDIFCSKHTIGSSDLHTNWITIISHNLINIAKSVHRTETQSTDRKRENTVAGGSQLGMQR